MLTTPAVSLAEIEAQLRSLLPAHLYAAMWIDPIPANLMRVFEHLRTLQYALHDYTPRQVSEQPTRPGEICYTWREGTLLFTDLAGFTPLLEANAASGQKGAAVLLDVINRYFSAMIEIISKSGGDLLEFTGDAMLVQFLADAQESDTEQAVRAGLRMQRAMAQFQQIETPQGQFSLQMRVGIHTGRFLTANIGTPMRMVHVLLGQTVQEAKRAEGSGRVGRVCLTKAASDRLHNEFQLEPHRDYFLIRDSFTSEQLGEYDITLNRRRLSSPLLFDRSAPGLIAEIGETVRRVEPLACYLPAAILNLLVENAAQRRIAPNFPEPAVMFINLAGLAEAVDRATPSETSELIACFSRAFALIHATVKARGGILQKVTYQSIGSDMLVYFGALNPNRDDAIRAVDTALATLKLVEKLAPPLVGEEPVPIVCRIGIACGAVFSAEIGEPRGRREFNILGDPVNTAARLMAQAQASQILITQEVCQTISASRDAEGTAFEYDCTPLGNLPLKGKMTPIPIFALQAKRKD